MAEGTSGGIVPQTDMSEPNARVREIFEREMGVTLNNFRAGSPRDEAMRNLTHETANLYAKRVLRELIQNAFDGAAAAEAPRILLRLDMQRGAHGTLYVANNGQGFTEYNLDAVVSPAMSNKSPGNFIGHKGLGFRSVELLSDDVRIYSMRDSGQAGSATFDGYRFGFAQRKDELSWLREAGAADVAEQVAGRVHRLQLPVALDDVPDHLRMFAEAGYATVICLPLRDELAAERAQEELRLLSDETAPITLFLHRLSALTIEKIGPDGVASSSSLSRQARALDVAAEGLSLEEVTVDGRRFLVARTATDEAGFRRSVEAAVAARHSVERWREWEKAPTIAVALPLSGDATPGAYYAFLPMERAAPFAGCLDAPFFPESDRRDLDLSNPLNGFLLDEVAGLCVRLAKALADAEETRPTLVNAAIDALAWTDETARLLEACERLGLEPGALRLPAMKRAGVASRWARIDEIYDWDDERYRTLHRSLLVKVCDIPMLPARLGDQRRANLTEFVEETEYVLKPPPAEWSRWAPMIAADLARRRRPSRTEWEGFYADLASMPLALPGLRGKAIFRLEDGALAPANGGPGGDGEELFLSVGEARAGRRGRVGGAVRIPPASIVKKMRFVDPQLFWPASVAGPFFSAQLATEYSLPRLLAKLGKMMGKRARRATVVAALGWAFDVWTSQRSPELDQALKLAGLLLPAKDGGAKAPASCYFGAGWRDTRGGLLADFLAAAPAEARTLKDLRAGLLPDWDAWPLKDRSTIGEWVVFLRLLGVVDGLRPIRYTAMIRHISEWVGFMSRDGAAPNVEGAFGSYWRSALRTDNPWGRFRYASGQYSTGDTLVGLPGQAEFVRFEPEAKLAYARLIMASLPDFSTAWLTTDFSRTAGNADVASVPSPLAAFLRRAAWLPVNAGAELAWKRPGAGWFVPRPDSLPRFISSIERSVRELLESHKATQDLLTGRLGLRLWNDPASAVDRLSTLGALMAAGGAPNRSMTRSARPIAKPGSIGPGARHGRVCPAP